MTSFPPSISAPLGPAASTALRLTGRDAVTVLHNISTNVLLDLKPGHARATLFCDFKGRLLHRAVVAVTADGALWLLRDDAPGAPLLAFVDRHVFREDVRLEDRSAEWPVSIDLASTVSAGTVAERDAVPIAARPDIGPALRLGAPTAAFNERERIEDGRPAHGREIVEAFTPYEVGLSHEVHLDKGCFTGQEALMRLVTYKSVRRRLARVRGVGVPPATPGDLTAAGERAGVLTSAVADADARHWIGIAVVKSAVIDAGTALELANGTVIQNAEWFPVTSPLGRP